MAEWSFMKSMKEFKEMGSRTYVMVLLLLMSSHFAFSQISSNNLKTIHVKFKEATVPKKASSSQSFRSGIERMDQVSEKHKAMNLKRVFPEAGVFELAHKAYGLHLWYEITFKDDVDLRSAIRDYQNLSLFHNVEECKEYKHVGMSEESPTIPPAGPNDTYFNRQWHFSNTGQSGGTIGADINLLKAWQVETGSRNVVVAIIDGGISLEHPDIASALWTNTREIPGNLIDDDRNGYVDDVHGYGFGDQSSTIYPDTHGTHVAGLIGATSNNSFGVAGIAGGAGSGDGVRLMSCAAFGRYKDGGFEQAMVYAADNGAVIAQNSWGGGSRAIEAAIDYFVARAGYNNNSGNFNLNIQSGPMAGGLVIFAAGNSGGSDPNYGYPASYKNSIAVASTDHNDLMSYFSNYGDWVDIAAPGSEIYSTIDYGYGFLSGTSMACPHVSGVAALVTSHIQKQGLKSSEVWDRLRLSARSLTFKNPTLKGLLGSGRLDAYIALREPDAIPPAPIRDLRTIEVHFSSITLGWTATGENGDEGQAAEYEIRYSTNPINESNFSTANLLNPPQPPLAGELVTLVAKNLLPNTTYYFGLKSKDMYYNESTLSNVIVVRTLIPPTPQVLTTGLSEQLFTGGISVRQIEVKNIGEEDELLVRVGVPDITDAPVGLPTNAKGRLFAINSVKNTIEELNTKTGNIINSILMPEPSSKTVEGLAFDGSHLFYGRSSKIYKINAQNGQIVRVIPLAGINTIRGLAWSGRYLFASVISPGIYRLYKIDSDSGEIIQTFDYSTAELTYSGSGGTIFGIINQVLLEFNPTTGAVIRELYIGGNPTGLGYSEVEKVLFVADGNSIKAINTVTGGVIYSIPYSSTTALAADEFKISWLNTTEEVIKVAAGATANIPLTFVATNLNTGEWSGKVNVIPMNVTGAPFSIPVSLKVTGVSEIETASELNFGTQYLGFNIDTVITIENRGYADLVVSNIHSNDNRIQVSLSSLTLSPGQKENLKVTIVPIGEGVIESSIVFTSNDIDEGNLSVAVQVNVLRSPKIEISPSSLAATLLTGETKSLTFTATNTGGSILRWNTNLTGLSSPGQNQSLVGKIDSYNQASVVSPAAIDEFSLRAPSPEPVTCLSYDVKSGMVYAKSLAGNNFYRYDPAANSWINIGLTPSSFTGQATYLDGKIYHGGSKLNVYNIQNNSWSSIPYPLEVVSGNLTSDGQYVYITLGQEYLGFLSRTIFYRYDPITNNWFRLSNSPNSFYGLDGGGISFHSGVIYFHVNPNGITGDGNTGFLKYYISSDTWVANDQISGRATAGSAIDPAGRKYYVINTSGQMSIRDLTLGSWVQKQLPFTVGGGTGLVFVGKPGVSGIYFAQGDQGNNFGRYETAPAAEWISITPNIGNLAPGQSQTITVNINAAGQDGGNYTGAIRVYSQHPVMEEKIPLTVTVIGIPILSIDKTDIDLGSVELERQRGDRLFIKNVGSSALIVSDIISDNPDFTISKSNFSIPPGEQIYFYVEIKSSHVGNQVGTLTIHNNDTKQPALKVSLKYNGVYPPVFEIAPSSLSVNLFTGEKSVYTLEVSNIGKGNTTNDYFVLDDGRLGWLKASLYGSLAAGETKSTQVTIDATQKQTGVYNGKLQVWYYGDLKKEIPVQMTVTGAPDILISIGSLDFGDRIINKTYDSTIQIMNNGVLPLSITSISCNNPTITISPTTPFAILPGESFNATVQFSPTSVMQLNGHVTIVSDDPDESTYIIPIAGKGVMIPVLVSSTVQLTAFANTNESVTLPLDLGNSGGSLLRWSLDTNSTLESGYNFVARASSPTELVAPVMDPATGITYAQSSSSPALYLYDQKNNEWVITNSSGDSPSGYKSGGATILNGKMYCVYPDENQKIFIFNIAQRSWITMPNNLGIGTGNITTDGVQIFLAGGGKFKSFIPSSSTWSNLSLPNFNLDGKGGLIYFKGAIYAHEGSGNGFAKYIVSTGSWETLAPLPDKAMLGSTIDPSKNRYYAYGKSSANFIYEYDMEANKWYVRPFNLFEISDGGMIYLSNTGDEGVYFIQGSMGKGFAKFVSANEFPWLIPSSSNGEIPADGSGTIGINFNAYRLNTGSYQGAIKVSSNAPGTPLLTIPVTFNVTNTGSIISVPEKILSVVEKSTRTKVNLKIENKSAIALNWNFSNVLPSWLSVTKGAGIIAGNSFEYVELTIDPINYLSRVIDYPLEIFSNDQMNPVVTTKLNFTLNNSPLVASIISTQSITTKVLRISLAEVFTDPDLDPLTYSAWSNNNESATVQVVGSSLYILPSKSGVASITVQAWDIYSFSVDTQFTTQVDDLVTGIEQNQEAGLQISPNPFRKDVNIQYYTAHPQLASICIFDITGKNVLCMNDYQEINGQNIINVDGNQLASGVYVCRLIRQGNVIATARLIKF